MTGTDDLSGLSMAELFHLDAEAHVGVLTRGLLALEGAAHSPDQAAHLDALMRAAHSIKGAARMSGTEVVVRVAHAMEDAFASAQRRDITLGTSQIDVLLRGVDLITRVSERLIASDDGPVFDAAAVRSRDVDAFLDDLIAALHAAVGGAAPGHVPEPVAKTENARSGTPAVAQPIADGVPSLPSKVLARKDVAGGSVRVAADHLSRLLGLAGESLVTSRWIEPFMKELLVLKRIQGELARSLNDARQGAGVAAAGRANAALDTARTQAAHERAALAACLSRLDEFDRRSLNISRRLYDEVLAARMRPFGDGSRALPRMVRDVARALGKSVRLEIVGESTPIDRDILQRLEAPLVHLLRNSVDHGIESPEERQRAGKPAEAVIHLEVRHNAGMLSMSISDDGRGVDVERIRETVVARGLTTAELAARLGDAELLEFLFLPGFSTRTEVTEISGRGVGLDVVQTIVREVGGRIDVTAKRGNGMQVQLLLPLTLSVVRALLVAIAGEPYAVPLARVVRVAKVPRSDVHAVEGREHFLMDGRSIGLVPARDVIGVTGPAADDPQLSVVVIGNPQSEYGLVVDALLGESELVVRSLDTRLGKVPHISAAAILPDGAPILILDVDDVMRATEVLVSGGRLAHLVRPALATPAARVWRVLVVDDSITVRETERKLLEHAGYDVDVAVDGMEAWSAVRAHPYDLVVTDIDMPRLDGIELTRLIRQDHRLRLLPVMIVSYKDREEDRARGLDAGADYYLTKASFHDDTLLRAAENLLAQVRG